MMQGPSGALGQLIALVGANVIRSAPDELAPFLTDHRQLFRGKALALARPQDAGQVAKILGYCNAQRIAVVPQGGNTSYCGGATPDESGTQLLLSLAGMNRIRRVDPLDFSLTAEAGCLLADVQRAAQDIERLFPLSLGSEGSCQIGGNLSTNAGGTQVLRYGMMRDLVLGLEVVLADGRVLSTLSTLRKDNTGYDIKNLFLGAEGTLGVITAASLKLFPTPRETATAFVAVDDVTAAIALLAWLREASGDQVSSFELIPQIAVDLTTRHVPGVRSPLGTVAPYFVLIELTSSRPDGGLTALLERELAGALERATIADAVIAQNEREREALWRLRESIPEAQRRDGASLKHDISVPVSSLALFHDRASAWVAEHVPEGVLVAYGHVGDGNLHFNINQRKGTSPDALRAREAFIKRAIHDLVREFAGSISAEHGIGRLKVDELSRYAPSVELDMMRTIKRAFDPRGIMNPGKVLAYESRIPPAATNA